MNIIRSRLTLIAFLGIVVLALFLRLYQLGVVPPALDWDEVATGYNAYSIANWGRDEWGNILPFVFKSFEDDKHPVHVYAAVPFVKLFGLSDFVVRLPTALTGVLNVVLLFFIGRVLFGSRVVGLVSSLMFAVSPYSLQFSRFYHESMFALFFFMFGLLLFIKSLENKIQLMPIAVLSFCISFLSYQAAMVVVPPLVFITVAVYWKKVCSSLLLKKANIIFSLLPVIALIFIFFTNPTLLGGARASQTAIGIGDVETTNIFKTTNNPLLGKGEVIIGNYLSHFSLKYLFLTGDPNARHSTQFIGEFYKIDGLMLIAGLIILLGEVFIKRKYEYLILIAWGLLAPLPASLTSQSPHAARSLFVMGSWHLIAAFGLCSLLGLFKDIKIRVILFVLYSLAVIWQMKGYLENYYLNYSKEYAVEWQYGMKQVVDYIHDHNGYSQVFMTDVRHQPYIFFLYFLKTPLPNFLASVSYNSGESRGYNLVSFYDKYFFGGWDELRSMPNQGVLYIVEPSKYDGLFYKNTFDVKKVVKNPRGEPVFYLISYP